MTEVLSQNEIDQLLSAISSADVEPERIVAEQDSRRIKLYDFKRPDKFSKEHIRTFYMMHEIFARLTSTSLSGQLRSLTQVHVASVDQLTYEEFIRSMPNPTTLASISMEPLKGSIILGIDSAITFSIIDRLFGGLGEPVSTIRELTDIEQAVMEGIIVRLLGNIREAWTQVVDVRPRLGQIETNPQFTQIVPPTEMSVVVTLEAKVNEIEGMLIICIPYITIEPIISKLSAQYWYSAVRRGTTSEHLDVLRDRIHSVGMNVIAEIGRTTVNVRDIISMKTGDVVRLEHTKMDNPIMLRVGDQTKFECKPGFVGNKVAVQIIKPIENITPTYARDEVMFDTEELENRYE